MGCQPQAEPCQEQDAGVGDNGTAADAADTPPSPALALGGEGLNPVLRGGSLEGVEKMSKLLGRTAANIKMNGQHKNEWATNPVQRFTDVVPFDERASANALSHTRYAMRTFSDYVTTLPVRAPLAPAAARSQLCPAPTLDYFPNTFILAVAPFDTECLYCL